MRFVLFVEINDSSLISRGGLSCDDLCCWSLEIERECVLWAWVGDLENDSMPAVLDLGGRMIALELRKL